MKITKELENGDFQQVEILGEDQKILDFIVEHEGGDLLEDLKNQSFVGGIVETGEIIKTSKNG
ncbi:hypothetical protein [uncultured Mediterranean phage uvMED]|nr:hypothetical protein [uncultured Mediterranean phage uvMED]BAR22598.1 hypothetical protein [uncultured Mediterranean phage uvMED]